MIIVALLLVGLCLGSFVNALVWRLHEQSLPKKLQKANSADLSISKGRSMCTSCGHTLQAIDLIPVASWITLRGKCRYCKAPISWQYPVVELATAAFFLISYLWWPVAVEGWQIGVLASWLVCIVGFMALIVYDLRWMILPNKIIFPLYGVALLSVLLRAFEAASFEPIVNGILAALVGGGLFYILFQLSKGEWIGGGDVKLGFLLGALLPGPVEAMLMLFIASLLGTLVSIPLMLRRKNKDGPLRIPFGPFLIVATIIVQLAGAALIGWYDSQFLAI